jgi:hypothetical protein
MLPALFAYCEAVVAGLGQVPVADQLAQHHVVRRLAFDLVGDRLGAPREPRAMGG